MEIHFLKHILLIFIYNLIVVVSDNTTKKPNSSTLIPTTVRVTSTISSVDITTTRIPTTLDYSESINSTTEASIECTDNTTCTILEDINGTLSTIYENATTNNSLLAPTTSLPDIVKIFKKYSTTKTCSCDLEVNHCDINCCCDKDCSFEDKLVFSKCSTEPDRYSDSGFCKYSEYIYRNNTPFEFDIDQNGLFCIVRSNLPKQFLLQKKHYIKSIDDVKIQLNDKYTWRNLTRSRSLDRRNNILKYGEPVWILRNGSKLGKLTILNKFVTTACLDKKEAKFLENMKTSCLSNLNDDLRHLSAKFYFANVTLISSLSLFNNSFLNSTQEGCPKNICIPLLAKTCNEHFSKCYNLTLNATVPEPFCNTSLYRYENSCKNLVSKIKYVIYHNGSQGIHSAEAQIVLKNYSYSLQGDFPGFSQEFEVVYRWINHTYSNYSSKRSGNPGYLMGKPILIANLFINETFVNDTKTNRTVLEVHKTILRNSSLILENFFALPYNDRGKCVFDENTHELIEFGYNTVLKCRISNKLGIPKKNVPVANICQAIQIFIFKHWAIRPDNTTLKVIGNFGNANMEVLTDWSEVLYDTKPEQVLNSTRGYLSQKNETIICRNMTSFLKVTFFHSRTVFEDLLNQEKIVRASHQFGSLESMEFPIKNNLVKVDLLLRTEIAFIDITSRVVKKYADPPSFQIKLPYDFFYPFIKINSGSGTTCLSKIILLIMVSYLLFLLI